jgi:hypothetical protein
MFNGILFIYFRTWVTVVVDVFVAAMIVTDVIVAIVIVTTAMVVHVPMVSVAIATLVVTAVEIPVVVAAVILDTTMDIVFLCFVCFPIVVTAIQV